MYSLKGPYRTTGAAEVQQGVKGNTATSAATEMTAYRSAVSPWADAASASSILKLLLRWALRLLLLLRVNKSQRFTTRGFLLTTSDVTASLIVQWRETIRCVYAEITSIESII